MNTNYDFLLVSFFLIFCCLCISSCNDSPDIDEFLYNTIPEYEEEDYGKLLDNKNPDIVYTAICNLIPKAYTYCNIISSQPGHERSESDSAERTFVGSIYSKISSALYSGNERIVCVSLRFFAEFARRNCGLQKEIANKLLKIDLRSDNIKLEYMNVLFNMDPVNNAMFEPVVRKLVENENWLVSRFAYHGLNFINKPAFLEYFQTSYHGAVEYEKLLMLSCIGNNFSDQVVDFLFAELKNETNEKVKFYISKLLENAENIEYAADGVVRNAASLTDIQDPMASYYMLKYEPESRGHIPILISMIKGNLINDSIWNEKYTTIFYNLYPIVSLKSKQERDSASGGNSHYYEILAKQIEAHPLYRQQWLDYKNSQLPLYSDKFLKAYHMLNEEYKRSTARLCDAFEIDTTYKKDCMDAFDRTEEKLKGQRKDGPN